VPCFILCCSFAFVIGNIVLIYLVSSVNNLLGAPGYDKMAVSAAILVEVELPCFFSFLVSPELHYTWCTACEKARRWTLSTI
jgi:hypothetical protein